MTKVACPKCGEENYPTDRQCLSCGTAFQAAAPPPPAAVTTPAAVAPTRSPVAADGKAPVYLQVMAVLPMGILILTRGGALWGLMGGALWGLNTWFAKKTGMAVGLRIVIMLAVSAVGYALVIPLVMAARRAAGE